MAATLTMSMFGCGSGAANTAESSAKADEATEATKEETTEETAETEKTEEAEVAEDAAGRTVGEDIFLVGVDALAEALENVIAGKMTGTVFNDHIAQSHSAADAAIKFAKGETNQYYIGCDYVKVTSENAQSLLKKFGQVVWRNI